MSLYQQALDLWTPEVRQKTAQWADAMQASREKVIAATKRYHDRTPLKSVISLSAAMQRKLEISLRYRGQEVATLGFDHTKVQLKVATKTAENTRKVFGLVTSSGISDWDGETGKAFRAAFEALEERALAGGPAATLEERHVQAMMWAQMEKTATGGFHACQPVLLGKLPFQCPVPYACNTGRPRLSNKGNMDILARRGLGTATIPAIWELKRPGVCGQALAQAYLYAVQLALMLRAPEQGPVWYANLGFGGMVPQTLKIDCILALTADRKRELKKRIAEFSDRFELPELKTVITPYVAWYRLDASGAGLIVDEPLPLDDLA